MLFDPNAFDPLSRWARWWRKPAVVRMEAGMRTYSLTTPPMRDKVGENDIHRLQRALRKARLYHGVLDGVFGVGTADACRLAKWRIGYPAFAVNRTGGQRLYDFLTGMKLPVAYQARRWARGFGRTKSEALRARIVANALWGVRNTTRIHYAQSRPIDGHHHPFKLPLSTDCSGFVTDIYEWAGGPDPNGLHFSGEGYTGTMLGTGEVIALTQAEPGDLVIWLNPPSDGHHVAVITDVTHRSDPTLVSHGGERGPLLERLSAENDAQGRPYQVRRYIPAR